jgi:hypothetical protein
MDMAHYNDTINKMYSLFTQLSSSDFVQDERLVLDLLGGALNRLVREADDLDDAIAMYSTERDEHNDYNAMLLAECEAFCEANPWARVR